MFLKTSSRLGLFFWPEIVTSFENVHQSFIEKKSVRGSHVHCQRASGRTSALEKKALNHNLLRTCEHTKKPHLDMTEHYGHSSMCIRRNCSSLSRQRPRNAKIYRLSQLIFQNYTARGRCCFTDRMWCHL